MKDAQEMVNAGFDKVFGKPKPKYTVDVRYRENGLLKFIAGTFDSIEEAEKHLNTIQNHLYDFLYAEIGITL